MFPNVAFRETYLCLLRERNETGGREGEIWSDRCTGWMKSEQRRERSQEEMLRCDRKERWVALKSSDVLQNWMVLQWRCCCGGGVQLQGSFQKRLFRGKMAFELWLGVPFWLIFCLCAA